MMQMITIHHWATTIFLGDHWASWAILKPQCKSEFKDPN